VADYAIAKLEDIEEIDDGRSPFRPIRHHLGITTFGINAMTARSDGDRLINEHAEAEADSSEELYFVVTGHARFELDGESREAGAGTFVLVPPGTKRTAFGRDAGTTVIAIGAGPEGRPYRPLGWELFAPLFPLFASGAYEEGADRAEAILANGAEHGAGTYYNTACFESMAGRTEAALAHLRQAVELDRAMAELARDDEDFAPLRDDPAFAAIVATAPDAP
jgi:hypothetical protein